MITFLFDSNYEQLTYKKLRVGSDVYVCRKDLMKELYLMMVQG
jgi:hypothetical protein